VTRAFVRTIAAATVVFALSAAARTQDWRTTATATFDDVWKTINDSFYDPTFGGLDWAAVAAELRPRVQAATTPDQARAVVTEMLSRLKRSHFVLLSATAQEALPGEAMVPAEVRITPQGALIVRVTDLAASRAGLAAGQLILRVDGHEVAPLIAAAEGPDNRAKGSTRGGESRACFMAPMDPSPACSFVTQTVARSISRSRGPSARATP
jgi:C-terminal processing protease CtpA/Prc